MKKMFLILAVVVIFLIGANPVPIKANEIIINYQIVNVDVFNKDKNIIKVDLGNNIYKLIILNNNQLQKLKIINNSTTVFDLIGKNFPTSSENLNPTHILDALSLPVKNYDQNYDLIYFTIVKHLGFGCQPDFTIFEKEYVDEFFIKIFENEKNRKEFIENIKKDVFLYSKKIVFEEPNPENQETKYFLFKIEGGDDGYCQFVMGPLDPPIILLEDATCE